MLPRSSRSRIFSRPGISNLRALIYAGGASKPSIMDILSRLANHSTDFKLEFSIVADQLEIGAIGSDQSMRRESGP